MMTENGMDFQPDDDRWIRDQAAERRFVADLARLRAVANDPEAAPEDRRAATRELIAIRARLDDVEQRIVEVYIAVHWRGEWVGNGVQVVANPDKPTAAHDHLRELDVLTEWELATLAEPDALALALERVKRFQATGSTMPDAPPGGGVLG